tara:strand:- start:7722 stop:8147 length:426 start_codon:yes stop_codon:yes gene_type:complete
MSLSIFKDCHNWFYSDHSFEWTDDNENFKHFDKWIVLKPVEGIFKGDCEDAALTIINRSLALGVQKDQLYVCRVATQNCPKHHSFDHAVALFISDDGKWWISDNRYSSAVLNLFDIGGYTFYDAVSIDNLRGIGEPKLIGK